jgi:4-hydroxyacetophenone monooxygenase
VQAENDLTEEHRFEQALAAANIPTLLMVLVQLTGNLRWLDERYRPTRTRGLDDNDSGGLPEATQAEVRAAALDAILGWRAGAPVAIPDPAPDLIAQMLSVTMADKVPTEYGPMFADELAVSMAGEAADATAPRPPDGFSVVIVGAGVSGLCAAVKLQELGIPYTIIENHDEIGGTWLENRYPGAGVDVPAHIYSFSFAPYDWSQYFALQAEIHAYLRHVADHFGVRHHIRFSTKVESATYDESALRWKLILCTPNGGREVAHANVLVSAVGAFNPPKAPAIRGLDRFAGPCFHTARWPTDIELAGKRVGVIGTGASAMQVVPAIADRVGSLTIFQRSPQWAQPFPKFMMKIPEHNRFLFKAVPLYRTWYRLRMSWIFHDKLHPSLQKDPSWPHQERSINAINDRHREYFTSHILSELDGRDDLMDRALPKYPPFGKRMLMDNGWFRTLRKERVRLVTDPVDLVDSHQVVTSSGESHELDVLVLATGFDVTRFVSTFEVRGRTGRTLREAWHDDDGRAFLGLAVPEFPNLFTLYGPNTQTGHGGSLICTVEAQVHYVIDLLKQMFVKGLSAVECRSEAFDGYNARVDAANEAMIWTHPGIDTYYRNSRGRVVVVNPLRNLEFWRLTRAADLDDFITTPGLDELDLERCEMVLDVPAEARSAR